MWLLCGHQFGALEPRDHRAKALDNYLGHCTNVLGGLRELDTSCGGYGRQFVHGFGLAIYEAAEGYLEEHRGEFLDGKAEADKLLVDGDGL